MTRAHPAPERTPAPANEPTRPPPGEELAESGEDVAPGGESELREGAESGGGDIPRGGAPASASVAEDAPLYPASGFRRPQPAERDCVENSVHIPNALRGFASGPVTAKFAVGADGAPTAFELIGDVPDARIAAAIWQAIRSCRWIAGADAQGRPAKLWVIMPIRFQAG